MDISVYITSYNQKQYLEEAIESVLAQTLCPREIIIVDDLSQDGSQALIAGYASRYPDLIVPVYHDQNMGVARTRNDALAMVRGDYVTYLDGDDRFLPEKLQKERALLGAKTDTGIVFSNVYYIDRDGTRTDIWAKDSLLPEGSIFCETFARAFPRGSLFRNELVDYHAWREIGFYDPELPIFEDYEMRIRLTQHLRAVYCNEPLSEYRQHGSGLSGAQAAKKIMLFDYIYKKNHHLLSTVTESEARYVKRSVAEWRAHLLRMQAKEALGAYGGLPRGRGEALVNYGRSLRHHLYIDPDLVLGLLLPHRLYQSARKWYREWRRQRRSSEIE